MAKVVGVRFRNVGKIYYFNPKNYKVKPGDHVIVEMPAVLSMERWCLHLRMWWMTRCTSFEGSASCGYQGR